LQGARQNDAQAVVPRAGNRGIRWPRRVGPETPGGQSRQKTLSLGGTCLKIPEHVLDQDHRRVDDDAEIDGADREQIGVLAGEHHNDDGEEQCERNIDADDDGAA
jgi:hypothetical protein